MNMWIDLSSCRGQTDAVAAVAMVTPRTVEKLTPIDPEPLFEELQQKPPEQQPPPPVPPPGDATAIMPIHACTSLAFFFGVRAS